MAEFPDPRSADPAEDGFQAALGVVRIPLGPQEWLLSVPPDPLCTAEDLQAPASGLAPRLRAVSAAQPAQRVLLLPVGTLDPGLGVAVARVRRGVAVIYSSEANATLHAARVLSVLASWSGLAGPGLPRDGRNVTVTLVPHDKLRGGLHPAAVIQVPGDLAAGTRLYACANLMTPALARALGQLWSENADGDGTGAAARARAATRRRSGRSRPSGPPTRES